MRKLSTKIAKKRVAKPATTPFLFTFFFHWKTAKKTSCIKIYCIYPITRKCIVCNLHLCTGSVCHARVYCTMYGRSISVHVRTAAWQHCPRPTPSADIIYLNARFSIEKNRVGELGVRLSIGLVLFVGCFCSSFFFLLEVTNVCL